MEEKDIFINNKTYPNPEDIFKIEIPDLNVIKNDCIYVLDTNALLLPFTTGYQSLEEIKKVFTKLITEKRLLIPGQVAREFANNRPEKLKEIYQSLSQKRDSTQNVGIGKYPLLESIQSYKELIKIEEEINSKIKNYRDKISETLEKVKGWNWNDPVSMLYKELFCTDVIYEIDINEEEIKKDLEKRYMHGIPPGYKDVNKDDEGIGDLLIWYSILEIAKKFNKNIIFVTGEEKSDWFHRSYNCSLYPRFELIIEFKNATQGKSFYVIRLSELLNIQGAGPDIIKEIEEKEKPELSSVNKVSLFTEFTVLLSISNWLKSNRPQASIIANEKGFPDIIIKEDTTGKKTGVEIITVDNSNITLGKLKSLSTRIREYRTLALNLFSGGSYSDFIFFVVVTYDLDVTKIFAFITEINKLFSSKYVNIQYVYGYLTEKRDFIQVIM
jgi:hypothetical protein